MAKRRYKKDGSITLPALIIRILIIAIFCAALGIAINRVAEVMKNDRAKKQLSATEEVGVMTLASSFFCPLYKSC